MKKSFNKAFTLVELLVVVTIMIILFLISTTIWDRYKEKTYNTKVKTDLVTTDNTLRTYHQETKILPSPDWNTKFYKQDWSYAHDEKEAFWLNGFLTETTLPKRFINITPLDPRTNHYYAYGKQVKWDKFEISWIISINRNYESVLNWNYEYKNIWTYNLIREYNWPKFVYDKSKNEFPYNPEELILTAKLFVFTWTLNLNGNNITNNEIIFKTWDIVELSAWWQAILYSSDWSEIHLWNPVYKTIIKLSKMNYKKENNLFSNIKIALKEWTILTKAPKMWTNSNYETYTNDLEASVRGTIYSMTKIPWEKTQLEVIRWEVIIYQLWETYESLVDKLDNDKDINKIIINQEIAQNYNLVWELRIENIAWEDFSILKENSSISIDSNNLDDSGTNSWTQVGTGELTNTWVSSIPEIICNENEHLQWEECVSNTKTWICTWNIPTNSSTWSNSFTQTWDSTKNKYLPETINWWFNQDKCSLDCKVWFELKNWECIVSNNTCSWDIPINWEANFTLKSWLAWNYSINWWDCTFKCKENYIWDWSQCKSNTREINCIWLPLNAIWNSASSITQTWSWVLNNFFPSNIWAYNLVSSNNECRFKCNNNYWWDSTNKICKLLTKSANCWWALPANSYRISNTSYLQTWNWTSYTPNLVWRYYTFQWQCSYNCNVWFHFEANSCIYNIQSCWYVANWIYQRVWNWIGWGGCTLSCNSWFHQEWLLCISNVRVKKCEPLKKPQNSYWTNPFFTQTWKNWTWVPWNVNRSTRWPDCKFECNRWYEPSWSKCVKSQVLYNWNGCWSCPFWSSKKNTPFDKCGVFWWSRYEFICNRLNVVCWRERKWSLRDTNCNKIENVSWRAYY